MNEISNRIKFLLKQKGIKLNALADVFGISKQSMSNKLARGSFSADDLITIAEITGAELSFQYNGIKIILDSSCLKDVSSSDPDPDDNDK